MADDIDIEEHDVFDNPRIKNIFPDLTRVKIEVLDSDDEDRCVQTDLREEYEVNTNQLRFKQPLYKNHIILGSNRMVDQIDYEDNPEISNRQLNQDDLENERFYVDDEFDDNIQVKQEPEDSRYEEIERHGSCIVLGSKPNKLAPIKELHDVNSSIVMLEDWGPRLQQSNCYCKSCEILFPTINCLDAHNMATHSFLVALSKDPEIPNKSLPVEANVPVSIAMKSAEKNNQFSTKPSLSDPSTSKETFCNHCMQMFPSETALIKHLYTNLPVLNLSTNTETELTRHVEPHHAGDEDDEDDNLDRSKDGYFRCDICFCYFKYSLLRHMKKNHGKSTFSTKRVPFIGDCKFCTSKFSKVRYLTRHVKDLHLEKFLKKSPKFSKLLKSKVTQQVNKAARNYKITYPEMHKQHNINNIKKKPVLVMRKPIKKPIKDQTKFEYNGVYNPPVPKSVLFKCNKCPLYFLKCIDAVFHSSKCNKNVDVWKCDVCSKSFQLEDKIIHERQHIVSERFIIYLIDKSVYGRTLCQCPRCGVNYSEQEFWEHVKLDCGQSRSVRCKICKVLINVSSTQMHERFHKNYAAKDLILIEFIPFEDTEGEKSISIKNKRKILEDDSVTVSKKSKISTVSQGVTKVLEKRCKKMYFCEKCKNYWTATRLKNYHLTGKCEILEKISRHCRKCGLFFSSDYHEKMMHKPGKTIFDFTFVRVQDNKIINPMPSYPMCLKCKLHFLNKKERLQHDCNNAIDHKICKYCKKKFCVPAYKLHITFHEYALRRKEHKKIGIINKEKKLLPVLKISNILSPITKSLTGKSPQIPELLKKYKLWTQFILYSCEVCDIVCGSYDKMVEHSQDHFNKMESYDMTIKKCEICDLRFDATCFDEHRDLHDKNTILNRQVFKILEYNYMNLFSDNWYELFGTLPRAQVEQIVSQSIYVHDRNIRMRITQHGPPENTVYKCGRCNGYLTASMVKPHVDKSNCLLPRYSCKLCHLDFSMKICLKEHETACRTSQQICRKVLFNDVNDITFNRGLQVTQQSLELSTDMTRNKTSNLSYSLYECEICKCCVLLKSRIKYHRCSKPSERVKCTKCNLFFKNKAIFRHRPLHKKFPKLSKRNVMTIPFKPESFKVLPKLYKCQCGLHFTSLQTAEKHLTLCEPKNQISKENCSKCGLLFPTSVLVSHLCSHHSNDKETEFDIQLMAPKEKDHGVKGEGKRKTNSKVTIHKCAQCDVCFISHRSLESHFVNHKLVRALEHCDQCNVNFTKHSMTRHAQLHHTLPKYSRGNLTIKVYFKNANQLTAKSVKPGDIDSQKSTSPRKYLKNYSKYLYQCRNCKIHFLSYDTCRMHYNKYHKEGKDTKQKSENCYECGLAFTPTSLARHVKIHHKEMRLKPGDLVVIQSGAFMKHSNDLYKCEVCDVHFLTREDYIKHCLNGVHSVNKFACQLCDYYFAKTSINRHIYMHHKLQKLSRKDFNIVVKVFDNTKFKGSQQSQYLKMNESTIVDENATRVQDEKDLKSNAIVTNRLYRCRTCSVHFCKESHLIDHVSVATVSGHNHTAAICQYCNLKFTAGKGIELHINEHHEKMKLTNEEFIIIENENVIGAYASRYLYKCGECLTHFVKESNAEQCDHELGKSKCRACGLLFSYVELRDHKNVHHNLMEMSQDDFGSVIIDVKRKSDHLEWEPSSVKNKEKTRKVVTMYKLSEKYKLTLNVSNYDNMIYLCRCGLHYLLLKTFKQHISMCNGVRCASGSKADCKICGLSFSARALSLHQYIQHEKLNLKLEDLCILTEKDIQHSNAFQSKYTSVNKYSDGSSSASQTDSTEKEKPLSRTKEVFKRTSTPNKTGSYLKCNYNVDLDNSSSVGYTETTQQNQTPPKIAEGLKSTESVRLSKYRYNLSESHLSSLNMDKYSNQLYRCKVCKKHHINLDTGLRHRHDARGEKCATCGLIFTSHIMSKHRYVHHEILGLNLADFHINHVPEQTANLNHLYKCDICDTHFLEFSSAHAHNDERCTVTLSKEDLICKTCGLYFSESLQTHEVKHHLENKLKAVDFTIIHYSGATRKRKFQGNNDTENISSIRNSTGFEASGILSEKSDELKIVDVDQSETSSLLTDVSHEDLISNDGKPSISDSLKIPHKKVPIKLYKCGDCNVFYITQNTCYKHMLRHEKLDSMEYIECKLCSLQFRILTLHKHITKHHKAGFDLENVLIEEYHSVKDKPPKIEIYYALDKIQSRLVSTTSDSKEVSEGIEESVLEDVVSPFDDQELIVKDSSSKNKVNLFATNNTVKNKGKSTVTEMIAKTDKSSLRKPFVLESAVKAVVNPIRDENLSKIILKDDSMPSEDQVVSTSYQNAKDITNYAVHKTVSDIKVKDIIDHVGKQIVTDSTIKDIRNLSAIQANKDSSIKHYIIPTNDKDIADPVIHKTVTEINGKDKIDHVVKQMMTDGTLEDISYPFAKQANTDGDVKHFIIPTIDKDVNYSVAHKTVSEIKGKDKMDHVVEQILT